MHSLATLISDSSDLHRFLLGEYNGAYSLGVGVQDGAELLILQVEELSDTLPFQQLLQTVDFNGMPIQLKVLPNFNKPFALHK